MPQIVLRILENPLMHDLPPGGPCVTVIFEPEEWDWWSVDERTGDVLVGTTQKIFTGIYNQGEQVMTNGDRKVIYRVVRGMYAKVEEVQVEIVEHEPEPDGYQPRRLSHEEHTPEQSTDWGSAQAPQLEVVKPFTEDTLAPGTATGPLPVTMTLTGSSFSGFEPRPRRPATETLLFSPEELSMPIAGHDDHTTAITTSFPVVADYTFPLVSEREDAAS